MSEWFASKDISEQCEEAFEDESPDKNSSATKETIANSLDILEQKRGVDYQFFSLPRVVFIRRE